MSLHSYSRCWLHLTWATLNRQRLLAKPQAAKVSRYLHEYAESKGIYMKIDYVNPDHTHALIDLPTNYSIEEVMKLLKGASSHWTNANRVISGKFAWGRGYGAFSVSHSNVPAVASYIANQEAHHNWCRRRECQIVNYTPHGATFTIQLFRHVPGSQSLVALPRRLFGLRFLTSANLATSPSPTYGAIKFARTFSLLQRFKFYRAAFPPEPAT